MWNFRPPWKEKFLKANIEEKIDYLQGKKNLKDYRFLKINKEARRVNGMIAMEVLKKKTTGEIEYCVQLNWNKATHWKNIWFQDSI